MEIWIICRKLKVALTQKPNPYLKPCTKFPTAKCRVINLSSENPIKSDNEECMREKRQHLHRHGNSVIYFLFFCFRFLLWFFPCIIATTSSPNKICISSGEREWKARLKVSLRIEHELFFFQFLLLCGGDNWIFLLSAAMLRRCSRANRNNVNVKFFFRRKYRKFFEYSFLKLWVLEKLVKCWNIYQIFLFRNNLLRFQT